jgi:hypothetical protein
LFNCSSKYLDTFVLGTSPQKASAILPAIAACVSASPFNEIANLIALSTLVLSKKHIIASGTDF